MIRHTHIKTHQLVKHYLDGNSIKETADHFNMSKSGVRRRLKKVNLQLRSTQEGLDIAAKKGRMNRWK